MRKSEIRFNVVFFMAPVVLLFVALLCLLIFNIETNYLILLIFASFVIGFAALVFAKIKKIKAKDFWNLGPSKTDGVSKIFYLGGYIFLLVGFVTLVILFFKILR